MPEEFDFLEGKTVLEIHHTKNANMVDMSEFRLDRFSEKKDAWIFVRRKKVKLIPPDDPKNLRENFLEVGTVELANTVDMTIYRYERFSELRGTWMFVKRTISPETGG